MQYPEILLVPLLMFADYFLTIYGALLARDKYNKHITSEHYELNPSLQKDVARLRWFNPRHTISTIVIFFALVFVAEYLNLPECIVRGIEGFFFAFCGMTVCRHISNILTYRYVSRHPQTISGQVTLSHAMVLKMSQYEYLPILVILILVAAFSLNAFAIGSVFGALFIIYIGRDWFLKYQKENTGSPDTEAERSLYSSTLWHMVVWGGIFILFAAGCLAYLYHCYSGLFYNPQEDIFAGTAARDRIEATLPDSARDFWVFDGGTFNGSIFYASFRCNSVGDCWKALSALGAPKRTSFIPDIKTKFAVNLYGPKHYWPKMDTLHWNLAAVTNGMSFETNQEGQQMKFWAVDLDQKRVFYHRESGGFPTDPPDEQ